MVLAGLVYQWMEWINNDSDRQDLQDKPTETIYFAALSFNGDIKFEPSTNYARAFVLTLAFWGLIMSSAYTANLASFLVAQNTPVLQIETVGQAVASNIPMCVIDGTAAMEEILDVFPQARFVPFSAETPNDIFHGVLNGTCTIAITPLFFWDLAKRNRTVNVGCQLGWIGRTFKFVKSGFVTRSDSGTSCTNLIRDVLSVHIGEMSDEGVVADIQRDYLRSVQTIDCDAGNEGNEVSEGDAGGTSELNPKLSLNDLGGLFIITYSVGAASCIAALISWYRNRHVRQTQRKSNTAALNGINDLELEVEDANNKGKERRSNGEDQEIVFGERDVVLRKIETMRRELEEIQSYLSRQKEQ
eukprot:CAMPEP_0178814232 /NCGR_PEP_ID=MMETSP0746-20121128/186_1 /TAXON_ID=913974 /ORGANISM="Nitzschia punctata, Strain CCMP561" /LENGTH=357 /DNA_ID=CAMNT_0020475131 /DNA_START=166 /DNA_END=1239 /DNA_ORIENTATION=-